MPDLLCDVDDVLLLEEIGREVVTGKPIEPQRTSTSMSKEVSVRLVQIKGVMRNHLVTDSPDEPFSLEGVRLVAAVLKDSQIVSASTPSDPLVCPSMPSPRHRNALAFEAQWNLQTEGGTLSFDHPSGDSSPVKLMIALVNGNEMTEEFLLASPCGETLLSISQETTTQNGNRRDDLAVRGLHSPRNFVLVPCLNEAQHVQTSHIPHEHTARFGSQRTDEEKNSNEWRNELELPYLGLDRASLCIEMSWKQKELDVEVCYTGQECKGSSQQEFVVDNRLRSYTPVRTHRLQKMESGDINDASSDCVESPISVLVGTLYEPESQRQVPHNISSDDDGAHASQTSLSINAPNDVIPEMLNNFKRNLALDDGFREEIDKDESLVSKESPFSDSENERTNWKISSKNPTKVTRGPVKKGKLKMSTVQDDRLSPDPPRHWTSAFRKPRSRANQPTSSTLKTNSVEIVLNKNERGNEAYKQEWNTENKESFPRSHMIARKGIFSGFRSKTDDSSQEILKRHDTESVSPLMHKASTHEELRIDKSRMDEISVLSIPKELQGRVPVKNADEDDADTIQLLIPFCSNGDEVLSLRDHASRANKQAQQVGRQPQRGDSHLAKEESSLVSHELVEPIQRDPASFAAMFGCALLTPPALCSSPSDVSMEYKIERQQSLSKLRSMDHFRSLEDTISKNTNKSDEITALSTVEDRMIMRAYHAMGGKHIDRVTDVILRNSPGMIQQWLDWDSGKDRSLRTLSADESIYYTEESVLSLADVDFERAETGPSQAIDRQLSTISEETESRGMQTKSDSVDTPSAESEKQQGREVEAEGSVPPFAEGTFVRKASF